jgi:hypothetical protein
MTGWLAAAASLIAIASTVLGAFRLSTKFWASRKLRTDIERLLETKNTPNDDSLTLGQIACHFGRSEDEVMQVMRRSRRATPWSGQLGNERRYRAVKR